jgi:predicted nuclease of predicted toxin-antitoxin system
MAKRFHRHKLLLDENFPVRTFFPKTNNLFDLKHITEDFKQVGLSDQEVYTLAIKHNRIIVTFNVKDFKPLALLSNKTGIIGVSTNMSIEQIDKKLTALLKKSTSTSLLGKTKLISGSSTR